MLVIMAVAVMALYSEPKARVAKVHAEPSAVASAYPLLAAVPSDAVTVACFDGLGAYVSVANDTTAAFGAVLTDAGRRGFASFVAKLDAGIPRSFRGAETVYSNHFSGELTPLLAVECPSDTTEDVRAIMALAESSKVLHRKMGGMLLFSPSEVLLTASQRHIEGGASVLDKKGFPEIATMAGGRDVIFASNAYAGKIASSYFNRPYSGHYTFFEHYADWVGFVVDGVTDDSVKLELLASNAGGKGSFASVFDECPAGESRIAELAPASTVYALSLPVSDRKAWLEAYRPLRDIRIPVPVQWLEKMDVREIASVSFRGGDGDINKVTAVRVGKEDAASFSAPEGKSAVYTDGWLVVGAESAVKFIEAREYQTLKSFMDKNGAGSRLHRVSNVMAYFCPSEAPDVIEEVFRPALAKAVRRTLDGISYEPAVLYVDGRNAALTVDRIRVSRSEVEGVAVVKAAAVVVPKGPFKVKNCGTGKMNTLSQAENNSLSLKDENGKGLWGIPFKTPLCGFVEEVDYYANGKIQFLFASGSKLWLLDRLGRFVKDFPAELGKDVLLGPGVYDFTGAHGYTAVVLHKDNTVGIYDLHGRRRDWWKGITLDETIMRLPELMEAGGKKYWVVRTSVQTIIYGFEGGEPLIKNEEGRMIRPDSELTINDKGSVSATCVDGRKRNFKL